MGGAAAPPRKRTAEYDEDATERGRSVASITDSVRIVFMRPRRRPPAMMHATSAGAEPTTSAATIRSMASSGSTISIAVLRFIVRSRIGAIHTLVMASATPQPKNVRPMPIAPKPRGNGENASSTKKPML